jgi:outer membrane protein insertion porin family
VILQKISARPGRPATQAQITEDVRALYDTRWFISIAPVYQRSGDGLALVFRVVEKPVVRSVEFHGNDTWGWWGIRDKRLEAETGLRPGAPYDVTINREAVQRIRELYIEKGYRNVQVTLTKGSDPNDRDVVFDIKPGEKVQVRRVEIAGNQFERDAVLKLGKETKQRWFFPLTNVGGKYDPESVPNDEIALTQYYQGLGFFDVEVTSETKWVNEQKSLVDVVFRVKEGPRFKVRNIEIVGEQVVPERKLRESLKLMPGQYFNARHLGSDVADMKANYDDLGRLFAAVNAQPVFLKEPGVIDLVYHIDEDRVYYIGDINVTIRGDHPHTQEDVVRNQVDAFIQPGSLANAANIRKMQSRLMGSHLWERTDPPAVNIRRVEGSDYLAIDVIGRAQSPSAMPQRPSAPVPRFGHSTRPAPTSGRSLPNQRSRPAATVAMKPIEFGHSVTTSALTESDSVDAWNGFLRHIPRPNRSRPPVVERPQRQTDSEQQRPTEDVVLWEISPPSQVLSEQPDVVFRAQSPDYRGQSMDSFGNPVPQDYLQGVSPQGDPYGNSLRGPIPPGFVDVDIDVTEARTGRLMFGVGVNSDAGVVGNIVLEENNFDITRPPRSFADIVNGQAWRGGGQSFRIEAVPGSEVSRYLVSWQDPFFLNTDFSLGTSGFFYTRFFENWNEERLGGRLSLGRLLGNFWSLSGAIRLENVNMLDIRPTSPPILTSVAGDNFLSTARVSLAHDTRDSSFLPTQGHLIEGSYEQAFGEFNYPRFELTASQFFSIWERPDGRGKHILQLRGQAGWTGDDTPIFERFYAGGFQSFRGFEFRGVTPRINNVKVGGQFMMLGTAEYIMPITADDNVRGVVFTDVGTVEPSASIDSFRASVGAGLRLIVPAMGPAPIALDFAYPLLKEDFDEKQIFSFYVGFTR